MQHPPFEIHAHRGARSFFPENTIPAFVKAVELGVYAIELDLCISGDKQVLVSHDPFMKAGLCLAPDGKELKKKDEARYLLYSMTYRDIACFDCGLVSSEFPDQQRVHAAKPLLQEVFRAVENASKKLQGKATIRYTIEIKSWAAVDGVLHPAPQEYTRLVTDVVESSGVASRVFLQSFDARILHAVREQSPSVSLGLLVKSAQQPSLELNRLGFRPDYLNPFFPMVDRELVEMLHQRSIRIVPWTVNTPDAIRFLAELGVDGIITDYPEMALQMMR